MKRSIITPAGHIPVDPSQDRIVLEGLKDRPDVTYLRREHQGEEYFYAWRPEQQAYGERRREVCEHVTRQEVQEAITERETYYGARPDATDLQALGFCTL